MLSSGTISQIQVGDVRRKLKAPPEIRFLGMALLDEIVAQSNGAHFLRADLHIHSYGDRGSCDVIDAVMTPEGIVDAAIRENLKVIAISEHNAVGNVLRALKHAENKAVLVVPRTGEGQVNFDAKEEGQVR